jgi:hypothetical protein
MPLFRQWLLSARGRVFLTAGAIGLVGLIVGAIMALRGWDRFAEIWLEIFAAPLILAGVEILIRWLGFRFESRERREFGRFFGREVAVHGARAVFPTAQPSIDDQGFCNLVYPKPPRAALDAAARAKGIKHVVPVEDLQAVRALAALFQKMHVPLEMMLDQHYDDTLEVFQREALIGIGLGFNHVTAKLAASCPDLFQVAFDGGTDDFRFRGQCHGFPADDYDCALVARVVQPGGGPPRFACAGRTAEGTAAAGIYLARHWKKLLREYKRARRRPSRDSMAVLLRFRLTVPEDAEVKELAFKPGVALNRPTPRAQKPLSSTGLEANVAVGT